MAPYGRILKRGAVGAAGCVKMLCSLRSRGGKRSATHFPSRFLPVRIPSGSEESRLPLVTNESVTACQREV